MMDEPKASAYPGDNAGVTATSAQRECKVERCEISIHIGLFFDGTGNNQDWVENPSVNWRQGLLDWWSKKPRNTLTQLQRRCDSNVARLFRAYPDNGLEGYFPAYIPGVGTPFKDIGEHGPSGLGAAFGAGGDGRINFGMLHVLNSMYGAISRNSRPMIDGDAVEALCRLGPASIDPHTGEPALSPADRDALSLVGMDQRGGLLMDGSGFNHRADFFKKQFNDLALRIAACPKPQLVEVFIDVFGFSRGAAQARAFCNWMNELFVGDRLAGVTTHLRFLGLFDTVAAVGPGASMSSFTHGHSSWGDPKHLRIPARVRHCEHYVAMHENRGAFPLEDVRQSGALPANCRQYRFPGMHSDVGGGYAPGEQGREPQRQDAEKLSQIPLNAMFDAAVAAKVPLNKRLARAEGSWDCFEVAPSLRQAYDAFLAANGTQERPLRDCLMDYLAWRIAVAKRHDDLPAVRRASAAERADLVGANRTLKADLEAIDALEATAGQPSGPFGQDPEWQEQLRRRVSALSPYAIEIVRRAKAWRPITEPEAQLFANYCHDSYAGFKPLDEPAIGSLDLPGRWEPEGYLRYRVRFENSNTRLTQLSMPVSQAA